MDVPTAVTLIVKAPNQQVGDQTIEVQPSWTIGELKTHLSEVYPSKPKSDEQRLIYLGRLLSNNAILKDILNTYESQETSHTMHLVCTPQKPIHSAEPKTTTQIPPNVNTDGLRQRNVAAGNIAANIANETTNNVQNHTEETQNTMPNWMGYYGNAYGQIPVNGDMSIYNQQLLYMHQSYMNYMQQYAAQFRPPNTSPGMYNFPGSTAFPGGTVFPGYNMPPTASPIAPPPPAAAPVPPPPAPEPEERQRDWLDGVAVPMRLILLLAMIYFHSSPGRLITVILLSILGYLYHIGILARPQLNDIFAERPPNARVRGRRPQQNQPENRENLPENRENLPENRENLPENRENLPENREMLPENRENQPNIGQENNESGQGNVQDTENNNQAQTEENNNRGLITFTWTVFSSFFLSLLPNGLNDL